MDKAPIESATIPTATQLNSTDYLPWCDPHQAKDEMFFPKCLIRVLRSCNPAQLHKQRRRNYEFTADETCDVITIDLRTQNRSPRHKELRAEFSLVVAYIAGPA